MFGTPFDPNQVHLSSLHFVLLLHKFSAVLQNKYLLLLASDSEALNVSLGHYQSQAPLEGYGEIPLLPLISWYAHCREGSAVIGHCRLISPCPTP